MWSHQRRIRTPALAALAVVFASGLSPGRTVWATVPLIEQYCGECHNSTDWAGGLAFDVLQTDPVGQNAKDWEQVVRKLRGGLMPPPGKKRPDARTVDAYVAALESQLDAAALQQPQSGRTGPHRLNRIEYANAIQDLLAVQVDMEALLPKDVGTEGFDNIADVLKVSPSFMDQYITAADLVTTEAVGDPGASPESDVYRVPDSSNQNRHVPGLPFGTRGGILIRRNFPTDGEYAISIQGLAGSTYIWGLDYPERVSVTLDGRQIFEGGLGGEQDLKAADQRMALAVNEINARFRNIRCHVAAGPHEIGVTFVAKSAAESDDILTAFAPDTGVPRLARVASVEIAGPFNPGQVSETPSRRKIFVCRPASTAEERPCAEQILTGIARQAFRRPVISEDLRGALSFYDRGRTLGGFDKGIQYGLMAILASPKFLYRVEPPPAETEPGHAARVSDLQLASRLSFFLWSRPPDEELLQAAAARTLHQPQVLQGEVRRMLRDPKAHSLVTSFAFQWLGMSALDLVNPDPSLFPQFDEDLRASFKREIEYFIASIFDGDRSIIDLLTANYTFVNGRLAEHYGIGSVRGDRFQKVVLADTHRWGLLGKGALLMATSYANRTAPVVRGAYILDRLMGTPPTPPPPSVGAFPENKAGERPRTIRELLAMHRANPTCNACHAIMDPLGLALENFNAVGEYQTMDPDAHALIDASGKLVDGTPIKGPDDLRNALARRPGQFAQTFTEKLMTFALGRTIEWHDMPEIRRIVRDAAADDYRFSSIVLGVVNSETFQTEAHTAGTRAIADKG
jgi:Protein of unknown function (DUF1592)/Protein of unknown function (DUF1588)/Protein of unknown function (DUF1585)/Protein of unknown function (DUF1587)/Protein of unknown function (DUF1595)